MQHTQVSEKSHPPPPAWMTTSEPPFLPPNRGDLGEPWPQQKTYSVRRGCARGLPESRSELMTSEVWLQL